MKFQIKNVNVLTPSGFLCADFETEDGKISKISPCGGIPELTILPGLWDVHTHGAMGWDFNTADSDGIDAICAFYVKHGVTSVLATVMTDDVDVMCRQLGRVAESMKTNKVLKGIHLEGPFLSEAFRGAQPLEHLKKPDVALMQKFLDASRGNIKLVTLAPEEENADKLTEFLTEKGIAVSLGHSGATHEQAEKCLLSGATSFTHVFNGMPTLDKRQPNVLTTALVSDAFCEIIADGKHVAPATVKLLQKAKTVDRVIVISDSLAPTGLADGDYTLGQTPITVKGQDAFVKGTQTRAGSVTNVLTELKNLCYFCGLSLCEAIKCFTHNQCRLLKEPENGELREGFKADFVVLDKDFSPVANFVGGEKVFERK